MKVKGEDFDRFLYLLGCIFTLGIIYAFRVIITEGVRQALINEKV